MKPTYLYIKEHKITGLKYFGKTVSKDPVKYKGGGVYWRRHIKKHGGEHVHTVWCELFTDKKLLIKTALKMSEELDIVNDKNWANVIPENGVDGCPVGVRHNLGKHLSEETKAKISKAMKGKRKPVGRILSKEHRLKIRNTKRDNRLDFLRRTTLAERLRIRAEYRRS